LRIPKGTRYQSQYGRKCRAEKAVVVSIEVIEDTKGSMVQEGWSFHDHTFRYSVGETVVPRWGYWDAIDECASGIHFYLCKEEALKY
jgi:hypothetical protein